MRIRLWLRRALPFLLAAFAFVAVQFLLDRFDKRRDAATFFDEPIRDIAATDVELQVVVHEVVEHATRPVAVRLCRSLAQRRVTLLVNTPEPLIAVLENLARQVGSHVAPGAEHGANQPLLTVLCPGATGGDYLTIGQPEG